MVIGADRHPSVSCILFGERDTRGEGPCDLSRSACDIYLSQSWLCFLLFVLKEKFGEKHVYKGIFISCAENAEATSSDFESNWTCTLVSFVGRASK